ncbi:CvpA family protein [Flexistipes sp.]|uniref:CvpA family protein n=1 Tax=Flexistipes sp. TaxID=3088135 RepID=UPI002E1F7C6C|nr:CvpA family protein [Flexistipes sp.]
MPITDIVILIVIGFFAVKGLFKGLINEVFGLLGLILGYILSFQFYIPLSKIYIYLGISEEVSMGLGFVTAFLLIYIVIFLSGKLLARFFKAIQLGWADKSGGFAFGAFKSAVITGLALSFLLTLTPDNSAFSKNVRNSAISKRLIKITPYVFDMLNKLPEVRKENPFNRE